MLEIHPSSCLIHHEFCSKFCQFCEKNELPSELIEFACRSFTFTPDGLLLVVANQHSHNLVSFYCDETTGVLKPTGYMVEVPCVACVTCVMGPAEDEAVLARW